VLRRPGSAQFSELASGAPAKSTSPGGIDLVVQ
jgi:hypothetical protein